MVVVVLVVVVVVVQWWYRVRRAPCVSQCLDTEVSTTQAGAARTAGGSQGASHWAVTGLEQPWSPGNSPRAGGSEVFRACKLVLLPWLVRMQLSPPAV